MKNKELVDILDSMGIFSEVEVKDYFGCTDIKKVYYDTKLEKIIIEID